MRASKGLRSAYDTLKKNRALSLTSGQMSELRELHKVLFHKSFDAGCPDCTGEALRAVFEQENPLQRNINLNKNIMQNKKRVNRMSIAELKAELLNDYGVEVEGEPKRAELMALVSEKRESEGKTPETQEGASPESAKEERPPSDDVQQETKKETGATKKEVQVSNWLIAELQGMGVDEANLETEAQRHAAKTRGFKHKKDASFQVIEKGEPTAKRVVCLDASRTLEGYRETQTKVPVFEAPVWVKKGVSDEEE